MTEFANDGEAFEGADFAASVAVPTVEDTGLTFLLERSELARNTEMHHELMKELGNPLWNLRGNE